MVRIPETPEEIVIRIRNELKPTREKIEVLLDTLTTNQQLGIVAGICFDLIGKFADENHDAPRHALAAAQGVVFELTNAASIKMIREEQSRD